MTARNKRQLEFASSDALPSRALVLYSNAMSRKNAYDSFQQRLQALPVSDLWIEVLQPGSPLAFLAAQGLRVAQPLLNVFTDTVALESVADRLEQSPDNSPDS